MLSHELAKKLLDLPNLPICLGDWNEMWSPPSEKQTVNINIEETEYLDELEDKKEGKIIILGNWDL